LEVGERLVKLITLAEDQKINLRLVAAGGYGDKAAIAITLDETTGVNTIENIWRVFGKDLSYSEVGREMETPLLADLARKSLFLTHPVFHRYRSETEMLRYLRKLADRDLALDRAMIPLGSCTMKLNATAEMIPVTWPEFGACILSRRLSRRSATKKYSKTFKPSCAPSPVMMQSLYNQIPGHKVNMRVYLPFVPTTKVEANRIVTSA
jgi:hypothetical protein